MQKVEAFLVAALHAKATGVAFVFVGYNIQLSSCFNYLVLAGVVCLLSLLSVALVSRLWTSKRILGDVAL